MKRYLPEVTLSLIFLMFFSSQVFSETTFFVEKARSAQLVFNQLDNEVEVRLNGQLVLQKVVHNNQAFNYNLNLLPLLKPGNSTILRVTIWNAAGTAKSINPWNYGYKIMVDGAVVTDVSNAGNFGKPSGRKLVHDEFYRLSR